MSCGPCNCDDCRIDRLEDEEPLAPIQRVTWQNVEPANEVQAKAWLGYVNEVLDEYKVQGMPMMTMLSVVARKIPGLRPENYNMVLAQIEKTLRESPSFEFRKGKSGGLFRKDLNTIREIKTGTLPPPIPQVVAVTYADNYTCKGCGNTKLHDKNDKSCWSCGRKVGT